VPKGAGLLGNSVLNPALGWKGMAYLAMKGQQEAVPNFRAGDGVETEYRSLLADLNQRLSREQRRRSFALALLGGCVGLLIFMVVGSGHIQFSVVETIPALGVIIALREYANRQKASTQIAFRCGFYERGLDRLQRNWLVLERTGEEFARSGHLYQFDLQILGKRSLFSLLCTTRSEAGAARLAEYLLDPVGQAEARARQEAVRELSGLMTVREQIALLGKFQFQGCDAETFREWVKTPLLRAPLAVPIFLALSGSFVLLAMVACLAQILSWSHALPLVLPVILVQAIVGAPLLRGVRLRLRMLRTVARECSVLQEGLQLLEKQTFYCSKLKDLVQRASGAGSKVRRLERLFRGIAHREKELFAIPSLLIAAGTQLVLAVERWRANYQEQLVYWIDLWAEFDALNAIACYAYENRDHVFPALVDEAETLEIKCLGHPLLPPNGCVRSDVILGGASRFWVLSGSNMAGKSTLLRALGVNAILAYAGAPIRAAHASLSHFSVCASIALTDSLLDGKSKFLTEMERLKVIIEESGNEKAVLFLIDEILSGTNSHDRRVACESMVRALIAGGAMGILSTHDLALTAIADESGLAGSNYCMESDDPDDPLHFDYRVKPGISRRSSAMAIVRLLGVPVNR
jgi:MutS domain V